MSKFIPADNGAKHSYDLAAALKSAITGTRLTGYAGEIAQGLNAKHGDNGALRVPLQAVMAAKATGSSFFVPGAVPLNGFDMDSTITELDGAVKRELLAAKFGVSTRATAQAEYRIPFVDSRPTARILDLDESIPDQGGSTFDYVSVKPVIAASMIEIANSLDFSNPDAVSVVTRQITEVVREAIDNAFVAGYGPMGSGISFAGLSGVATNTALTLNTASTISGWADLRERYGSYVQRTDVSDARWLMHPRVTDQVLAISPLFAGSMHAISQGVGITNLLGNPIIQGRLPVAAGTPETTQVYFGDPAEIFLVMFDSASISLVANPYETAAFAKGSTLLRIMVSFGMAARDPKRLYRATVQLP